MANSLLKLPEHLVNLIMEGLEFEDLIRLCCVNREFKSLLSSSFLPPQLNPSLIVPYGDLKIPFISIYHSLLTSIPDKTITLGLFNHSNGEIYKVIAPEMAGHRIIGSCQGGWLITVHNYTEIRVSHLLSKSIVDLPPITKITNPPIFEEDYFRYLASHESYTCKATMSSDNPSTSLVMAIVNDGRSLLYCRPGIDTIWSSVRHTVYNDVEYEDVRFFNGRFYVVGKSGGLYVIDDLDSDPHSFIFRAGDPFVSSPHAAVDAHYLVESLGELFLVRRTQELCGDEIRSYKTTDVKVRKLNLDGTGTWVNVDDLGVNRAFFLGCYSAFSLSTSDYPSCRKNSIYFTDGCVNIRSGFSGCDVVVFDLDSGVIEKCYSKDTWSRRPPPVWYTTTSG